MSKCGDCLYFGMCSRYVDAEETFSEIDGGCHTFKSKDAFVEVVRCKDCKYQEKHWKQDLRRKSKGYYLYWCNLNDDPFVSHAVWGRDDEFCCHGERKGKERNAD